MQHPYFIDRIAKDQWDALTRLACADAAARRRGRARGTSRTSNGRNARLTRFARRFGV